VIQFHDELGDAFFVLLEFGKQGVHGGAAAKRLKIIIKGLIKFFSFIKIIKTEQYGRTID
jgi:hypothetical protein